MVKVNQVKGVETKWLGKRYPSNFCNLFLWLQACKLKKIGSVIHIKSTKGKHFSIWFLYL